MPEFHRIEIYDRNFQLQDFCAFDVESAEIINDYLTLSKSSITLPKIMTAKFGDYIYSDRISGVIQDVEYVDGATTITFLPMQSIINLSVYFDRNRFAGGLAEAFCYMIEENLIENEDTTQNIPGLAIDWDLRNDIENPALNIVDNVNNIFDLAVKALKKYRMVVDIQLHPYESEILVVVYINTDTVQIKAKPPYVASSDIFIAPINQGVNKLIGVWKDHEDTTYEIKKNNSQTVSIPTTEYFDGEALTDFQQAVLDKSYDLFSYDETQNYIALTVYKKNNLYDNLKIGDLGNIDFNNQYFNAVLTKISESNGIIQYVFGAVRLTLTDKLILGGL